MSGVWEVYNLDTGETCKMLRDDEWVPMRWAPADEWGRQRADTERRRLNRFVEQVGVRKVEGD